MKSYSMLDFPTVSSSDGNLTVIHGEEDIPFSIARVYYLTGASQDSIRGGHAHRSLRQVLVAVSGSFKVSLDDGLAREEILLNDPKRGLFISGLLWRDLHSFSSHAVCMVVADTAYDESDYVRDYEVFLSLV